MKKILSAFASTAILITSFAFNPQDDELKKSMAEGKKVYSGVCLACHMQNGQGISGVFPPLAESDYLMKDSKRAIETLISGLSGPITVNKTKYNQVMPATGLDDKDIADVLNYVMNSWGNEADKMITVKDVVRVRESLK